MNVSKLVGDYIKKTIDRLSKEHKVEKEDISIVIGSKVNGREITPYYFYAKNGVPVSNENGLVTLDFVRDILGKKIDMLGYGAITDNFLKTYFRTIGQEYETEPNHVFLFLSDLGEKEITVGLFKSSELIRTMKLSDVFE